MGRPVMPEPPFEEMVLEQINELREIMFSMMRLQRGEDVEPPKIQNGFRRSLARRLGWRIDEN
eukprot:2507455-Pleurochrysis_carterae.AAC.1